ERADNAVDRFGIDQIIGQMVVDFAVREVAAVFTELDQHFQAIATSLLFLGSHLVARGDVLVTLRALSTALGQRLEFGDDFSVAGIVVVEIGAIVVGVLGRPPRATPSGNSASRGLASFLYLGRTRLGGFLGSGLCGRRFLSRSL